MTNEGNSQSILAIDYGQTRIGLAVATYVAHFATPLTTLKNDDNLINQLKQLIIEHRVNQIVVGLPRSLAGSITQQTEQVILFINQLKQTISVPIHSIDEAVTSIVAEKRLKDAGKLYVKEDIDAMAACIILEDYMAQNEKYRNV